MLRLLDLVGLLAPLLGAVLLVRYRRRSRAAFALGAVACAAGLAASAIGLLNVRLSVAAAVAAGEGLDAVLERMDGWAVARFALLVVAGGLLVVASIVDRRGRRPVGWIASGALLLLAGIALHAVAVDLGPDRPRLTTIASMLLEVAQTGLLGLGLLVLCVAAVANRPAVDGRAEPSELASRVAGAAWRALASRGAHR